MGVSGIRKKLVCVIYDADTYLGINNEGELVFKPGMEYTDVLPGGADIWNGQKSVLFVNERLAFDRERWAQYRSVRQSGALDPDSIIKDFDEFQAVYPERMWNEDARISYEEPLLDGRGNYLEMDLGPKKHQRRKFITENIWYFDSKALAGKALQSVITIRSYAKSNLTITPYQDLYASCKFGSYTVQARTTRGTPATLICPVDTLNDTETYIYCASRISDIGDISGLKPGLVDISAAVKLQRLIAGSADASYENMNLKTLALGTNRLIRVVDVRGAAALGTANQKSVDASGCINVEELYFDRTSVTGVVLPVGGILKKLHLPATVTNITIRNHKSISELVVAGYSNVSALRIENSDESSAVSSLALLNAVPAGCHVRLTGFTWEMQNAAAIEAILDRLDTMQGIDIDGQGRDVSVSSCKSTVSGTIHTASLTGAQVASYNERYPYITIAADMTTSYRYAHDEDGTLLDTIECHDGVPQSAMPTGLTKANSADGHYSYTFAGWSLTQGSATADPHALDEVIADRHLYAVYTATVRTYPVYWNNSNGNRLETDEDVEWGTTPHYDGTTPQNPTSGGGPFTAWVPAPAPITGPTTYTATYTPMYNVYYYLLTTDTTPYATAQVLQGGSAVNPADPVHPSDPTSYSFNGWSPSPTNVQGNLSVYAQWKRTAATFVNPGFDVSDAYAVQWHYDLDMAELARGGLAASFNDPVPAASVSGGGSSPFDSVTPWSGMKIYCDVGGTMVDSSNAAFDMAAHDAMVWIPEFYYKSEKDTANQMWTWAISPTAKTGYTKHLGSGRYVGRYHTGGSSSGVYSRSGVSPLVNTSQTNFRAYSEDKGAGWHMMDLATWSAIQLLYLVEFANFDSQTVLGKGWNTGSIGSMGGTDSAAYHTVKATGAHNQYRWIEDPFSNCLDWIDGFVGSNSSGTYAAAKDSYAGGSSDLTALGFKLPSSGAIRGFGYSEAAPWAFIPDAASGTDYTTYVCDRVYSDSSLCPAYVGGSYRDFASYGFFYFYAYNSASNSYGGLGSRLQKT